MRKLKWFHLDRNPFSARSHLPFGRRGHGGYLRFGRSNPTKKLASDVVSLNAAIQVYRTHGGDLSQATTPEQVIAKLKTQADDRSAATMMGLRGNMVDLRLRVDLQNQVEAQTQQERAIWNKDQLRFEVRTDGGLGVKQFSLEDEEASTPVAETRTTPIKAGGEGWVWDYQDGTGSPRPGFGNGPGTQVVDPRDPLAPPNALQLNPPLFSQAGGKLPLINFDLSVTLSNPNPPGTSEIFYAIDGGNYSLYKGETLTVPCMIPLSFYCLVLIPGS